MKKTRINDVQATTLAIVKARIEASNPQISRNRLTALQHKYGEGTLQSLPRFATEESGGLPVLAQLIAPTWDEEHGGVYVPLLNIIIQPKNLVSANGGRYHEWAEAKQLAEAAGGRLFTKDEAYVLLWQKDAINAILEAHDGDPLSSGFWSSSECNENIAWLVYFSSGNVYGNGKYNSNVARAVVAL